MNPDGTIDWYYVWATLIIRFVGVFILLSILAIGISLMTRVVAKITALKDKSMTQKQG